jgi:opacity protein-like surface antigen
VIYGILGVEARKFKVGFNDSSKVIEPVINKKYTSVAFTPGVGARFAVSENLSIRAEYKCAIHKSKTINVSGINQQYRAGGALADQKVSIKVSPVVHSFNVGLVYSF